MTTETTTPSNDSGGVRIGTAPPADAVKAAMAAFDGLDDGASDEPQAGADEGQGEPAQEAGEGEGKPRRVVKDAKELAAEEEARKAKEIEDATPGAFKARRRQLRELETAQQTVATQRQQLEGMRVELKSQLDKADQYDALEAELKASPVKVLKRYGIDLTQLNVAFMAENSPGAETKGLAQELADLKKQWAEEKAAQQKAAEGQAYEATVATAIEQLTGSIADLADEYPAMAFFAGVEPARFKLYMRQAIDMLAKGGGKVYGEQVVKLLDDHYREPYAAIKPRLTAGTSRPSTGPTTAAKLEKAPQSLGRATSTPVGSKDPESYEERFKAALNELS